MPRDELRRTSTYVPVRTPVRRSVDGAATAPPPCVVTTDGVEFDESLPPNFHATITSAVSTAIPSSASSTTLRSMPRSRFAAPTADA